MGIKWLAAFLSAAVLGVLICFGINYFVDPVGVFTQGYICYEYLDNIRHNKIKYLDDNNEKYNSYIFGGSKAGAIQPETANKYIEGASFYNQWIISGDFYDYEKTIKYVIDNYDVKNILLEISLYEVEHYGASDVIFKKLHPNVTGESKIMYYGEYLMLNLSQSALKFEKKLNENYRNGRLYNVEDGTMMYQQPDISLNMEEYLETYPNFKDVEDRSIIYNDIIDENAASLKAIKEYCDANNVNLIVVTAPTYGTDLESFNKEGLKYFWRKIAEVVDFWDFSGYNSVNEDPRNFYDRNHFTKETGDLILARIFNDASVNVPDDFGGYRTKENIDEYLKDENCRFYKNNL